MKKLLIILILVIYSYVSKSQTLDLYHEVISDYLERAKFKKDTINIEYKDFLDSTRHNTRNGKFLNFISESDFSNYCDEKNTLIIHGVFPIYFKNGEIRIRIVGYGVKSKKEKMLDGVVNEHITIASGSYIEYKAIYDRRKKAFKLEIVSEH